MTSLPLRELITVILRSRAFSTIVAIASLCLLPRLLQAQTGLQIQWMYTPITQVSSAVYSPDGSLLAVTGNGGVQIFQVSSNTLVRCLPATYGENCLAFSPDGKTLAGADNGVQLWDVSTGKLINTLDSFNQVVYSVAFSPDGKTLAGSGSSYYTASGEIGESVEIWNLSSGIMVVSTFTANTFPSSLAYSPDGTMIATCGGGSGAILQILDPSTGKQIESFKTGASSVYSVAFSPDGKTLAGGGTYYDNANYTSSGVLELWDVSTGQKKASLKTVSTDVVSVRFSPNGKILADGTFTKGLFTGDVELWNASTSALITTLDSASNDQVDSIGFSPDGKTLATCGTAYKSTSGQIYNELDLWNVSTGQVLTTISTDIYTYSTGVAVSPDSGTVALAGTTENAATLAYSGWIGLWNASTGKLNTSLAPAGLANSVVFSPDGTLLADGGYSFSSGGLLELWNLSTGNLTQSLATAAYTVQSVAFSPDGAFLAEGGSMNGSGMQGGSLELWNVSTGTLIMTLATGANEGVTSVAFSPDGTMLAASGYANSNLGYYYGVVEIWNVSTGTLITSLDTGILNVYAVAFSPDGKTLADGGQRFVQGGNLYEAGMEIWDVASETRISTMPALSKPGSVSSIKFSADGRILFVGSDEGLQAFATANFGLLNSFSGVGIRSITVSPNESQVIFNTSFGRLEVASNPYNVTAPISGVTLNPSAVTSGTAATGTVTISQAAPASGLDVQLTSSSAAASVPETVTVAAGANTAVFNVATKGVNAPATVSITASSGGSSKTATLTINPATLTSVALSGTSVVGGSETAVTGTITLSGLAAAPGGQVTLLSSDSRLAAVPSSVTVAPGESTAVFSVTHFVAAKSGTTIIYATFNGITQSVVLTVNPFQIVSLTVSPTTVDGTQSAAGTVGLNAVPGTASGAVIVKLASNSTSAIVSASVSVAVGSQTAQFTVKTTDVSETQAAKIVGRLFASLQQATLTIQPLPTLSSVSISPSKVVGSSTTSVVGIVTTSGPAPAGGFVVKLTSSNAPAATVPASVMIPAGSRSASFTVSHSKVAATKFVTIGAMLDGRTRETHLTVTPG